MPQTQNALGYYLPTVIQKQCFYSFRPVILFGFLVRAVPNVGFLHWQLLLRFSNEASKVIIIFYEDATGTKKSILDGALQ